jgi:hypothetical protein
VSVNEVVTARPAKAEATGVNTGSGTRAVARSRIAVQVDRPIDDGVAARIDARRVALQAQIQVGEIDKERRIRKVAATSDREGVDAAVGAGREM